MTKYNLYEFYDFYNFFFSMILPSKRLKLLKRDMELNIKSEILPKQFVCRKIVIYFVSSLSTYLIYISVYLVCHI